VNGTQASSKAASGNIFSTTDPLRIGGDWSGAMFAGLIDNVRIYNRALRQAEVQADMSKPVGAGADRNRVCRSGVRRWTVHAPAAQR
jgi:hypothetical protein